MQKKMKDFNDDERKAYFRDYYHKQVTVSDKNCIAKIAKKDACVKLMIDEIGILRILQLYKSSLFSIKIKKPITS
jgi:hypothetical protein